jgi:hypothetical protein
MSVTSVMTTVARRRGTPSSRKARNATFAAAVAGTALLAGITSEASPTGLDNADFAWRAGLVAAVAYFAGTSRRWTWFLPAGVAAALAGDSLALACAGGGIGIGFWSVLTETRNRTRAALAGGLGTAALLSADPIAFHGATALLTTAAVLPMCVSGYRNLGRRTQGTVRRVVAIGGGVVGLLLVGALLGIVSVSRDLTNGARLIDEGIVAARDADDDLAGERLQQAARHLTSADSTLTSWFVAPARILPLVGPNIEAVESLAREAGDVARVTSAAADAADVDELRFVDGRLDPEAVSDMEEPLEETVDALDGLVTTVDTSDSPWLAAPLGERLERLQGQLDDALPDAELALSTVRIAPDMLGASAPRRYLVLFTTPVEARGRTGFPGNFAELLIQDGQLSMPRFGRISELEQGGTPGPQRRLTGPPDYLARYGRFDLTTTWRNLTMGADFPSVAVAIKELYPQSGGQPIDGVIAVDPVGLAELLRYTGDVAIPGLPEPLTPDNTAAFLMLNQYVEFTDVSERVDILEEVARTTFERLTSADLPSPGDLAEQLDPVVDGGHIQAMTFDTVEFLFLQTYGLSGSMSEVREGHDLLAVTSSNAAGSKIDLFLERQLAYDVTWDPDTGRVSGTVTATLTNGAPASGLPDYVIGNVIGLPRGTNRSFVSIYTPHDVAEARVNGQPAAIQSEQEAMRNVYSTFVEIPPGGTVTVELDVRGTVEGDSYRLDIDQQPLARPEEAQVAIAVAGDDPVSAGTRDTELDGRVALWSGTMDRARHLGVDVG